VKRAELFGYAGLLLLVGAGALRLLVIGSGAASLILAGVGAAALIAYLFAAGTGVQSFLDRRATREGSGMLATTVFAVGALVLVNLIAGEVRWHRDLTAERLFTLAPETISVLKAAPQPPEIWVFQPDGTPDQAAMKELVESARLADPRVETHIVDPLVDPAQAFAMGVREPCTVVKIGDNQETFTESDEEHLSAAVQRASRTEKLRVGVLNGHGESYPGDEGGTGFSQAGSLLHVRGYEVRGVNLLDAAGRLSGFIDVLVIPGPQVSPAPAEMDSLVAYVDAGGRLLVLLDPSNPGVTLEPVLDRFGLRFDPGFVADPDEREPQILSPSVASSHPAVRDLAREQVTPVLPGAGSFTARPREEGRRTADLFSSGSKSTVSGEAGDRPRVLAMAAELDRPSGPPARLAAIGDVDFAENANVNTLGNGDLFLGAARWLAERADVVSIRPRPRTSRPVVVSRQQGRAFMVLLVGLAPLAVLAAGAAVWWKRR